MSHRITGPSNYYNRKLIRDLWKTKRRIWKKVSKKLSGPRREKVEANLYRINKKTKENDVIVVPGKVLGVGEIDHKLTIACLTCSKTARKKIETSGSKLLSIEELLEQNPEGKDVKVFY
ncbi:MAG: 50S ribosomal protein L18e [Candidatus Lokiarchaeota archaeon]|nr:50S ribosomal protein L18e [Candidatus Lokiarchaeota archaeon]